jgi:hypothetical protein
MNRQRILQQLNTVEARALMAGVAMATGQQLTDDPAVDAAFLLTFILGGIFERVLKLAKSSRQDDTEGSR